MEGDRSSTMTSPDRSSSTGLGTFSQLGPISASQQIKAASAAGQSRRGRCSLSSSR